MVSRDIEKEIILCLESEIRLYNKFAVLCLKLKEAISSEPDLLLINNIILEKVKVREEVEKVSLIRVELIGPSENSNNEVITKLTGKLKWVINKIIEYEKEFESKLILMHKDIGERLIQINKGYQMIRTFPKASKLPSYISINV